MNFIILLRKQCVSVLVLIIWLVGNAAAKVDPAGAERGMATY